MQNFINSVVAATEKYRELNKQLVSDNLGFTFTLLCMTVVCLTVGVAVLYVKLLVVNSCIVPVFFEVDKP